MSKNKRRFIPLLVSIGVVVGILLGSFFASHFAGNRLNIINTSSNKINDLLHLIDDQYVDSVNIPDLVEKSMPGILAQLDPHSTYVSSKDVEASM
ncbi:MAG: peptidase S41, partial [Alloprevotella tannerae]|nr:peptidase S41 [Alloprevotella tannerae]